MKVKVGDVYIRDSTGKSYRVKKIDNTMVILQSLEDPKLAAISDIFSIKAGYTKSEEPSK